MAKSRTQIAREHVARIRRKAQAYDLMVIQLRAALKTDQSAVYNPVPLIKEIVREAEQAVQE